MEDLVHKHKSYSDKVNQEGFRIPHPIDWNRSTWIVHDLFGSYRQVSLENYETSGGL